MDLDSVRTMVENSLFVIFVNLVKWNFLGWFSNTAFIVFFVVIIVLHFPFFYRRLGDEMRSMSLEKSRQREAELAQEIERLQMEIKTLQKNSEEAANVNQQLSKEVRKNSFDRK